MAYDPSVGEADTDVLTPSAYTPEQQVDHDMQQVGLSRPTPASILNARRAPALPSEIPSQQQTGITTGVTPNDILTARHAPSIDEFRRGTPIGPVRQAAPPPPKEESDFGGDMVRYGINELRGYGQDVLGAGQFLNDHLLGSPGLDKYLGDYKKYLGEEIDKTMQEMRPTFRSVQHASVLRTLGIGPAFDEEGKPIPSAFDYGPGGVGEFLAQKFVSVGGPLALPLAAVAALGASEAAAAVSAVVFGVMGAGQLYNYISDSVDQKPDTRYRKENEAYDKFRDTMTEPEAKTKMKNIAWPSIMAGFAVNAAGGVGLSKLLAPKGAAGFLASRGVGAAEGAAGFGLQSAGMSASRQVGMMGVGLQKEFDPHALAMEAAEGFVIGGVVGTALARRTKRPEIRDLPPDVDAALHGMYGPSLPPDHPDFIGPPAPPAAPFMPRTPAGFEPGSGPGAQGEIFRPNEFGPAVQPGGATPQPPEFMGPPAPLPEPIQERTSFPPSGAPLPEAGVERTPGYREQPPGYQMGAEGPAYVPTEAPVAGMPGATQPTMFEEAGPPVAPPPEVPMSPSEKAMYAKATPKNLREDLIGEGVNPRDIPTDKKSLIAAHRKHFPYGEKPASTASPVDTTVVNGEARASQAEAKPAPPLETAAPAETAAPKVATETSLPPSSPEGAAPVHTPEHRQQALETSRSLQVGDIIHDPMTGGALTIDTRVVNKDGSVHFVVVNEDGKAGGLKEHEIAQMFLPHRTYVDAEGVRRTEKPATITRAAKPVPEGAAPKTETDTPVPEWTKANSAAAIKLADDLGVTERIGQLAKEGKTAAQISEAIGKKLSPVEVRAVRDYLGIEPAGPAGFALGPDIPRAAPEPKVKTKTVPEAAAFATLVSKEKVAAQRARRKAALAGKGEEIEKPAGTIHVEEPTTGGREVAVTSKRQGLEALDTEQEARRSSVAARVGEIIGRGIRAATKLKKGDEVVQLSPQAQGIIRDLNERIGRSDGTDEGAAQAIAEWAQAHKGQVAGTQTSWYHLGDLAHRDLVKRSFPEREAFAGEAATESQAQALVVESETQKQTAEREETTTTKEVDAARVAGEPAPDTSAGYTVGTETVARKKLKGTDKDAIGRDAVKRAIDPNDELTPLQAAADFGEQNTGRGRKRLESNKDLIAIANKMLGEATNPKRLKRILADILRLQNDKIMSDKQREITEKRLQEDYDTTTPEHIASLKHFIGELERANRELAGAHETGEPKVLESSTGGVRQSEPHPDMEGRKRWVPGKLMSFAEAILPIQGGPFKPLADRLAALLSRVEVHFRTPEDLPTVYGNYIPTADRINVRGTLGNGHTAQTLLHEGVHAGTYYAIRTDNKIYNRATGLLSQLKIIAARDNAPATINKGLKNVDEMVAYGLTDLDFQEWLSKHKMPGRGGRLSTGWRNFKALIKDALGLKTDAERSALDEVLDVGNQALTRSERNARTVDHDIDPFVDPLSDPPPSSAIPEPDGIDHRSSRYVQGSRDPRVDAGLQNFFRVSTSNNVSITARDLALYLTRDPLVNSELRPLKALAQRFADLVSDMPVYTPEQAHALGFIDDRLLQDYRSGFDLGEYHPDHNYIILNIDRTPNFTTNVEVALHELGHAIGSKYIRHLQDTDPKHADLQALRAIGEELRQHFEAGKYNLDAHEREVFDAVRAYGSARAAPQEIYTMLMSSPTLQAFAASRIASPELRATLSRLGFPPRDQGRSVWRYFTDWMRRAFGLKAPASASEYTMLDHVIRVPLDITDRAAEYNTKFLPKDPLLRSTAEPLYRSMSEGFRERGRDMLDHLRPSSSSKVISGILSTAPSDRLIERFERFANSDGKNHLKTVRVAYEAAEAATGKFLNKYRDRTNDIVRRLRGENDVADLMDTVGYSRVSLGSRNPEANAHLTTPDEIANLRDAERRFNALTPEQRRLYTDTRNLLAEKYAEERAAVAQSLVNRFMPDASARDRATMLEALRTKAGTEAFLADPANGGIADERRVIAKGIATLHNMGFVQGDYFPMRRYGDYVVEYGGAPDDPRYGVQHFESRYKAEQFRKDALARGLEPQAVRERDSIVQQRAMTQAPLVEDMMARVRRDPNLREHADELETLVQHLQLKYASSAERGRSRRRRIAGASKDVARAIQADAAATGLRVGSTLHAGERDAAMQGLKDHIKGMSRAGDPNTLAMDRVHHEFQRRLGVGDSASYGGASGLARRLSSFGYAQSMLSFSRVAVETAEIHLKMGAFMSARYNPAKVSLAMGRALKDISPTLWTQGAKNTAKAFIGKPLSAHEYDLAKMAKDRLLTKYPARRADINAFFDHFERTGQFDQTTAHGLKELARPSNFNGAWNWFLDVSSAMGHASEESNRIAGSWAAYELGLRDGKSRTDALQFAEDVLRKAPSYSPGNRPRIATDKGVLGKFGAPIMQFKMYGLNETHLLANLFRDVFSRTTDPVVRKEAALGLLGVIAVHSLAAGVLTWLADPVRYIGGAYDILTGNKLQDRMPMMRKWLSDSIGPTAGELLGAGMTRALGVDTSHRMGVNNMLNIPSITGLSRSDLAGFAGQIFLGASGQNAEDFVIGMTKLGDDFTKLSRGDMTGLKGLQMMLPRILRDPLKAHDLATKGVTDPLGKQVLPPSKITPWNVAAQAIGFTPAIAAEARMGRQAEMQARDTPRAQATKLKARWLDAEDAAGRAAAWSQIARWNQDPANQASRIKRDDLLRLKQQRHKDERKQGAFGLHLPKKGARYIIEQGSFANVN